MPVAQAADGMPVERDHVYVIPPNAEMSLLHGRLHLLPLAAPRGLNLPIDLFFRRSFQAGLQLPELGVIGQVQETRRQLVDDVKQVQRSAARTGELARIPERLHRETAEIHGHDDCLGDEHGHRLPFSRGMTGASRAGKRPRGGPAAGLRCRSNFQAKCGILHGRQPATRAATTRGDLSSSA